MKPPFQFHLFVTLWLQAFLIATIVFALPQTAQSQFPSKHNKRQPKTARFSSSDSDCLNPNLPKPKTIREKGLLNQYAIKLPQPRYPTEAIKAGIAGEVTVEIAVNLLTGKID